MIRIDTPELLAAVCRRYVAGHVAERVFAAATIEAIGAGVDAKPVLADAGVVPSSLPRYATLVSAGFFS